MGRGSSSVASGSTDTRNRRGPETRGLAALADDFRTVAMDRTNTRGELRYGTFVIGGEKRDSAYYLPTGAERRLNLAVNLIENRRVLPLFNNDSFEELTNILKQEAESGASASNWRIYRDTGNLTATLNYSYYEKPEIAGLISDLRSSGYQESEIYVVYEFYRDFERAIRAR